MSVMRPLKAKDSASPLPLPLLLPRPPLLLPRPLLPLLLLPAGGRWVPYRLIVWSRMIVV